MTRPPDGRHADDAILSRLLHLGTDISSTPVQRLLVRLDEPDASPWLARLLARPPLDRLLTPDRDSFAPLTLIELQDVKSTAKSLLSPARSPRPIHEDDAHLATLAYFLTLAAAREQHGIWLTSQSPVRVARELWDLATALPESLSEALARAATHAEAQ